MRIIRVFRPYAARVIGEDRTEISRRLVRSLELELSAACGREPENNLLFEVCDESGHIRYFWFHDLFLFIGKEIAIDDPKRAIVLNPPKEV